jgi:tripartite-type tricarboxylate transporter receptor subunit TctC
MRKILTFIAVAALVVSAHAQDFPGTKPITMVVPFSAGGPTDRAARDLAEAMRKPLGGATIVIKNVPGDAFIGASEVARATPDGYTLLFNHIGQATIPALSNRPGFSLDGYFEYLGIVTDTPMMVLSRPDLPANSPKELFAWVDANKDKITIGSAGVGSASYLCGLLFQKALKTPMTFLTYAGTAPAITALNKGELDLLCDQTTTASSSVQAKKVKAFAVTTPQRLTAPVLKDLPTLQEAGLKDFSIMIWQGLYAPKNTPAAITHKLNEALKSALKDPEFIKKQEAAGAMVATDGRIEPEGHKAFVRAETARWLPILKAP